MDALYWFIVVAMSLSLVTVCVPFLVRKIRQRHWGDLSVGLLATLGSISIGLNALIALGFK